MVSNVPDAYFSDDEVGRVRDVLRWLIAKPAPELRPSIWSRDRIHRLFVDDPGGHDSSHAKHVLKAIEALV